jgi:transcription elongation GreA/GreB family factor
MPSGVALVPSSPGEARDWRTPQSHFHLEIFQVGRLTAWIASDG